MTYTIHTTDAFIVKNRQSRDADSSLLLFTEKFGLLNAVSTSARQIKSKLRFSLQTLSFSSVSLVKGREVWRVTSAKKLISLYDKRLPIEYRAFFARILLFIERFCPREVQELEIFELVRKIAAYIFKQGNSIESIELLPTTISGLEKIAMFNMLFELGYIKIVPEIEAYRSAELTAELIMKAAEDAFLIKMIEKGIAESHL